MHTPREGLFSTHLLQDQVSQLFGSANLESCTGGPCDHFAFLAEAFPLTCLAGFFLDRLEDHEARDLERAVEFHLLGNQAGRLNENSFNIFRFEICAGSDSCIESGGARHGFEPVTAADAF